MTVYGNSYEKQLLLEFLQQSEELKDPMTGKELESL